jgi:hypothetical protein
MKSKLPSRGATVRTPRRKLIAYQIYSTSAPIVPAPRERQWMDDSAVRAPYRCLPMVMANQYGWEILATHKVRATWDGRRVPAGIKLKKSKQVGGVLCHTHFGEGVLTFTLPFIFRTPPGWNLMVRGPTNRPKDGLIALDGIVETDWAHSTFTMNWRFTRACTIEFAAGEPVCMIFPIQRGVIETFTPQIRSLRSKPGLQRKFHKWQVSRGEFIKGLSKRDPETVKEGWQKDYMRAAIEKKPRVCPI